MLHSSTAGALSIRDPCTAIESLSPLQLTGLDPLPSVGRLWVIKRLQFATDHSGHTGRAPIIMTFPPPRRDSEGAEILTKGTGTSFVWTQTGLYLPCGAVGWWMASSLQVKPRSFTIPSCAEAVDEVGLSHLDAANKSEWHNITRPEALAAH